METPNLNSRRSVRDVEAGAQLRDKLTHEDPRAVTPEPLRSDSMNSRLAGASCGDPAVKPSSADLSRLSEVQRHVGKMIGCGEGDLDAILVTACLSSVATAAFTLESYNMFSLDPCDQTIPLSTHISSLSLQPIGVSNGTPPYWPNIADHGNVLYKPSASAIRINALVFLSLVLSLIITISAAWAQPSSRLIPEIPRHRRAPHKDPDACIFGRSTSSRVVEAALHLSVSLFIVGLVDFLLSINKTVAFFVLGFVPAFPSACLVSTVLPSPWHYRSRRNSNPLLISVWHICQIVVVVVVEHIGDFLINICRRFGIRLFCVQPSLAFLPRHG